MNLRIEEQTVRFRISKEELETLCSGGELQQVTPLPGLQLDVRIAAVQSTSPLVLKCDGNRWQLQVDMASVQALLASLPSREGLIYEQTLGDGEPLCLMLEVDIRTQKRKRG